MTLPATMNDKLTNAIRNVSFDKTSSVKWMLFTAPCKDMDADHETLLFYFTVK